MTAKTYTKTMAYREGEVKIFISDDYAARLCADAISHEFTEIWQDFVAAKTEKTRDIYNARLDVLNMMYRQLTGKELMS